MRTARIKLRCYCTRSYKMEQIDIKSRARSRCVVELALEIKKESAVFSLYVNDGLLRCEQALYSDL